MKQRIIPFLFGAILCFLLVSQLAFRDQPSPAAGRWEAPGIPASLDFANESVPLDRWDIREKLDRELLLNYYSPGNILYLIKLSNRNFPVISERLKANGVPDDFKYLCIAESNMQPWALSKAGAVGYWQFLSGTALGYGLEVNEEVDQRQDLEKATDAACRYFKQSYSKFGNWTAAAASYNCGQGGYNGQAVFQRTTKYYDLNLPEETNKYMFRILTFKYLLENAESLGFVVKDEEKYPELATRDVIVKTSLPDLAVFAIEQGTSYKILRTLNPWIRGRKLTVKAGKEYVLRLPAKAI